MQKAVEAARRSLRQIGAFYHHGVKATHREVSKDTRPRSSATYNNNIGVYSFHRSSDFFAEYSLPMYDVVTGHVVKKSDTRRICASVHARAGNLKAVSDYV